MADNDPVCYESAGAVVVSGDRVLALRRPSHGEMRLPKGHVETGEKPQTAALRETREESGYTDLVVVGDLGTQIVEFSHKGRHVIRAERYFLMALDGSSSARGGGEEQFEPTWLAWEEAVTELTFEAEREWVRRGQALWQTLRHQTPR